MRKPSSEPARAAEAAFWNEALRGLPDATFVLLPPPRPTAVAGRIATLAQAEQVREAAVAGLATAWSLLTDGLPVPTQARATWWIPWQGTGVQVQIAGRHPGLGPGSVRQRLGRVKATLVGHGERADGLGATTSGPGGLRASWHGYRAEVDVIGLPPAVDVRLTGAPWAADDEIVADLLSRLPETTVLDDHQPDR